eukprot:764118-Pyramimonas_sp.AAC.1
MVLGYAARVCSGMLLGYARVCSGLLGYAARIWIPNGSPPTNNRVEIAGRAPPRLPIGPPGTGRGRPQRPIGPPGICGRAAAEPASRSPETQPVGGEYPGAGPGGAPP